MLRMCLRGRFSECWRAFAVRDYVCDKNYYRGETARGSTSSALSPPGVHCPTLDNAVQSCATHAQRISMRCGMRCGVCQVIPLDREWCVCCECAAYLTHTAHTAHTTTHNTRTQRYLHIARCVCIFLFQGNAQDFNITAI